MSVLVDGMHVSTNSEPYKFYHWLWQMCSNDPDTGAMSNVIKLAPVAATRQAAADSMLDSEGRSQL